MSLLLFAWPFYLPMLAHAFQGPTEKKFAVLNVLKCYNTIYLFI